MELDLILERDLTTFRPPSGTITDIHVHQNDTGKWYINVRLSWHRAALFHVGLYDKKRVRFYRKLSSAVRHIVMTYAHTGMIAVHPHPDLMDKEAY
jgi:hypothetical protein